MVWPLFCCLGLAQRNSRPRFLWNIRNRKCLFKLFWRTFVKNAYIWPKTCISASKSCVLCWISSMLYMELKLFSSSIWLRCRIYLESSRNCIRGKCPKNTQFWRGWVLLYDGSWTESFTVDGTVLGRCGKVRIYIHKFPDLPVVEHLSARLLALQYSKYYMPATVLITVTCVSGRRRWEILGRSNSPLRSF